MRHLLFGGHSNCLKRIHWHYFIQIVSHTVGLPRTVLTGDVSWRDTDSFLLVVNAFWIMLILIWNLKKSMILSFQLFHHDCDIYSSLSQTIVLDWYLHTYNKSNIEYLTLILICHHKFLQVSFQRVRITSIIKLSVCLGVPIFASNAWFH